MGILKCVICSLLVTMLAACAVEPVKPWQRGQLAEAEMAWEVDAGLSRYRQHVQFSKEAASSQIGQVGGGCGCN